MNATVWLGKMADCAGFQNPGVALQGNKLEGVARLAALGYGMGRVVTAFAINATVPL
jgi:hypothetical protein